MCTYILPSNKNSNYEYGFIGYTSPSPTAYQLRSPDGWGCFAVTLQNHLPVQAELTIQLQTQNADKDKNSSYTYNFPLGWVEPEPISNV